MESVYALGTRISGPQVFAPYDVYHQGAMKAASADEADSYWP